MYRRKISAILVAVIALFAVARADVPPEPGNSRISVPLTIETNEDLSDYRFFIESPMQLEEVTVHKGTPTVIGTEGRAGAAAWPGPLACSRCRIGMGRPAGGARASWGLIPDRMGSQAAVKEE